ncbi:hypothetical protein [Sciscionella sediminilitoris]|uniref:hypothetical protein n=1 Tax=Sciscionella sediminilitoris TaxID=1445613 RepID=UPI0018D03107|nr:hypothetical protein [Sciscionella sp. SE31]
MTRTVPPGETSPVRPAIRTMYAGLVLTVTALVVPFAAKGLLAGHVRAGYPGSDQAQIDSAVSVYVTVLAVVGALGVLGWVGSIWAASARKAWARWAAATLFVLGTITAVYLAVVKDTSGDTGVPPVIGWLGVLPCVAGLVAVVLLWLPRSPRVTG